MRQREESLRRYQTNFASSSTRPDQTSVLLITFLLLKLKNKIKKPPLLINTLPISLNLSFLSICFRFVIPFYFLGNLFNKNNASRSSSEQWSCRSSSCSGLSLNFPTSHYICVLPCLHLLLVELCASSLCFVVCS